MDGNRVSGLFVLKCWTQILALPNKKLRKVVTGITER
jgi:hypothetical protein